MTYVGAYHHVMNRGYDGNDIFSGNKNKAQFLDYLEGASQQMKIRIFAYCIMDNHYHLVLENSSGMMSEFLKLLNGQYYFSDQETKIVDADFVNQLFGSKRSLLVNLASSGSSGTGKNELPVKITKHGEIFGSDGFLKLALKKHNRRQIPTDQSLGVQRRDDRYFEPVEKILWEFKDIHGVNFEEIETETWPGKRLRGELLVMLKDRYSFFFGIPFLFYLWLSLPGELTVQNH